MTLKQYHDQTVYTGGLNCPTLRTSVVIASEAEAVLAEKDAEIARLKKQIEKMRNCYNCGRHDGWPSHCLLFEECGRNKTYIKWEAQQ